MAESAFTPDPVTKAVFVVLGIGAGVWATWATVVAFTGGTLPLVGWEIEGGVLFGFFWLFIVDPLAMTVAWWVVLLIGLPLVAISEGTGRAAQTISDSQRSQERPQGGLVLLQEVLGQPPDITGRAVIPSGTSQMRVVALYGYGAMYEQRPPTIGPLIVWTHANGISDEIFGLPASYLVDMASRQGSRGLEFRLGWTDHGDDPLANGISLPSNSPVEIEALHDDLAEAMIGLGEYRPKPSGRTWLEGIRELDDRATTHVDDWTDCPLCGGPPTAKATGAFSCEACRRLFSEPGTEPTTSEDPDAFRGLNGIIESAGLLIEWEQGIADRPRVHFARPEHTKGTLVPVIVNDNSTERAVVALSDR